MPSTANWKLTLSYDGSGFHGWQIQSAQSGLATIQGTLSEAIARLTGERVLPQGSGRTDAGVHALAQVCSFPLAAPIPAANLQRALNRILPAAIRILSAHPVPPTFHARHSALSKTYEYRIFERKPERRLHPAPDSPAHPPKERICSPFLSPFAWDCRWPLSLERMQQAAALLLGTHDFTSMAAADPEKSLRDSDPDEDKSENPSTNDPCRLHAPTTINPAKTITFSGWHRTEKLLIYRITGNGFLHHMVRNLVGTLVEIGRNSLEINDLSRILKAKDRSAAGPTAPACGLFLAAVHYDSTNVVNNVEIAP
jgi:tRNA pseudouridine38-40 synthase